MRIDSITAQHLLGVSRDADAIQVRSAFRARVKEHHPDALRHRSGDDLSARIDLGDLREARDLLVELGRQRDPFETTSAGRRHRPPTIDLRDERHPQRSRRAAGGPGSARLHHGPLGGEPAVAVPSPYPHDDELGLVLDMLI